MTGRLVLALILATTLPPTRPVDDDYTAVRKDVLEKMNLSDINLPKCEKALAGAQDELVAAAAQVAELRAAATALQDQKTLLTAHIAALETVLQRGPSVGDQFAMGWERVDAPLGLALGWGIGTAQCVGLAWAFNQPSMR